MVLPTSVNGQLTRVITSAPNSAELKSSTWKGTSSASEIALVNSNIRALITKMNKPSVTMMKGSPISVAIGFTMAFTVAKIAATMSNVTALSPHEPRPSSLPLFSSIPPTTAAATHSAAALMPRRIARSFMSASCHVGGATPGKRVWAAGGPGHLTGMRVPRQWSGFLAVGGVLIAGTLLVAGLDRDAASQSLAGTCTDGDVQPTSCADPGAVYQVLTTVASGKAGCPDGDYFEERTGAGTLCLGYNVAAGDCVQDDPHGPTLIRCTTETRTPTIRVLKVVEDRATSKACRPLQGGAVKALTYTVPAKTLCIVHQPLTTAG